MNPIFLESFSGPRRRRILKLAGIAAALLLLAGCGGIEKIVTANGTGSGSGAVNPLTVASISELISGGISCDSHLILTNPNPESYQFVYRYDGLNQAGQVIATVVFDKTIGPSTTSRFFSKWQIPSAPNAPKGCASIVDTQFNGVPSVTPVNPVAVIHTTANLSDTTRFSGTWTSPGTTDAWGIGIDDQGTIFGQNGQGCLLEGKIGDATGVDAINWVRLSRSNCGRGMEDFSGVILIDPKQPSELYLWSHDAQDSQFNLTANR